MRRLLVTSTARRDHLTIIEYVARSSGNVHIARNFGHALLARCARLASLPGTLGVQRPEFGPDVRATFHRDYVIVFRYEPGRIRILRFIEGHREVARLLGPEDR